MRKSSEAIIAEHLGWAELNGSARKWWEAFEEENAGMPALVHRLTEELRNREAANLLRHKQGLMTGCSEEPIFSNFDYPDPPIWQIKHAFSLILCNSPSSSQRAPVRLMLFCNYTHRKLISRFLLFSSLFLFGLTSILAKDHVLIISGQVADQASYDAVSKSVATIHEIMSARGFSSDQFIICFNDNEKEFLPSRKSDILAAIEGASTQTEEGDRHWLFLFGHAQKTLRGTQITTRGPRLKVEELVDALDSWKGEFIAFAFNRQSAAFFEPLSQRANVVVSAHDHIHQLNAPVFPNYLLSDWLVDDGSSSLLELLKRAGASTEKHFKDRGLALAERSQVFDGSVSDSYPYEQIGEGSPLVALLDESSVALSGVTPLARTEVPIAVPDAVRKEEASLPLPVDDRAKRFADEPSVTHLPDLEEANEETLAVSQLAQDVEQQCLTDRSVYLKYDKEILIGRNNELTETFQTQLLILSPIEAERHQVYRFPQSSQRQLTFESARLIYSDGSYRDVEAATRPGASGSQLVFVEFPNLQPGCVIELAYSYESKPDLSIPFFNYQHVLEQDYPVANAQLSLSYPKEGGYRYRLYNLDIEPEFTENRFNKSLHWQIEDLRPYDSLPYSLPSSERSIRLVVSDLASWDAFAAFVNRVLVGVDSLTPDTEAWVIAKTQHLDHDVEKLKVLYDELNALEYLTKPVGLRSLRPYRPDEVLRNQYGDCKDKANALVSFARFLGIKGHFVLLNRTLSTDPEFPSWQFNHALAYFPQLEGFPDGLWLDPTDPGTPFASLPPGDYGRVGMAIDKESYFFKETFAGNQQGNALTHIFSLNLQEEQLSGSWTIQATGLADYGFRSRFRFARPSEQRQIVQSILNNILPLAHVTKFTFEE
ncbi:MAG: DUF3857 domain-containing protein, partial [Opitutales bacterium]